MLSRLLRRLQGRTADAPTADAAVHAHADAPTARAPGTFVDPAPDLATREVRARFLAHLLDAPLGVTPVPAAADDALARLEAMATHLDVARLPRLPAIVPQLMAALRRDDADATSLAALLARDPTLSGDVIRIANSAHYRRGAAVSALPQAVSTIGADGLRYAVLTSVARPILQADPARHGANLGARLSAHCESRTWLCSELAPAGCDAAEAQLASVIAATGTAALLRMLPRALLAPAAASPDFAAGFFALAADVSSRAALHWHLGEPVRTAIVEAASPEGARSLLGEALACADRLAMLQALGMADDAAGPPLAMDETPLGPIAAA